MAVVKLLGVMEYCSTFGGGDGVGDDVGDGDGGGIKVTTGII